LILNYKNEFKINQLIAKNGIPITKNQQNNNQLKKYNLPKDQVYKLINLLNTLKRGENIVEKQRQKLASMPQFEPHTAF